MEWWGNTPPSTMSWVYNDEPLYALRYSTLLHRSEQIDFSAACLKRGGMKHSQDGFVSKAMALCQVVVGLVYMPSSWSIYIIINSHLFHIYFLWTRTILNCSTEAGYTRNTQLRNHPVNYTVSCTFYAKLHQGHQSHHNLPSSSFDVHIVY